MRRVVSTALLLACGWAEAGQPAPVFVFVGLSEAAAEERAASSGAALVTKFIASEDVANRNTNVALDAAGWEGFGATLLEQFGCFGVGEAPCRSTTLVSPNIVDTRGEHGADQVTTDGPLAAVVTQLFIDTQPIARVSFLRRRSKGRFGRISQLNIQYFDPPAMTQDEAAYPFYEDPERVTDTERAALAASRALWFGGDPSPLESVLRGFVNTVPRVLDRMYSDLAKQKKPFDLRTWYASLKPIKSYARAHDFDCRINDCDTRLLHIASDAGQAWLARYYESDLVIRVVPCEWLWCEPD